HLIEGVGQLAHFVLGQFFRTERVVLLLCHLLRRGGQAQNGSGDKPLQTVGEDEREHDGYNQDVSQNRSVKTNRAAIFRWIARNEVNQENGRRPDGRGRGTCHQDSQADLALNG